jgi:hypothetical protein
MKAIHEADTLAKIPEFLLKALYVKGSLRNAADGFEFQMKNDLGPARIIGARSLQLDRRPVPLDSCSFEHGDNVANFADVDEDNSVLLRKGEVVTIQVRGQQLRPGWRTLGINVIVKDLGNIIFTVRDSVR